MPYGTWEKGPGSPGSSTGAYFYHSRTGTNSLLDPFTSVFRFRDNQLQTIVQKGNVLPIRMQTINGRKSTVTYVHYPVELASFPPELFNKASAIASIGARSDVFTKGQVLAGVFLAESKKTVNMITHRVLQLTNAVRLVKRRRFREAARVLQYDGFDFNRRKRWKKDWQSNWLEYRYGWRPLIMDVNAAIGRVTKGTGWGVCKGKGKFLWEDTITYSDPTLVSIQTLSYSARSRAVGQIQHEALNEANALGLSALLPTIWELVPYSFVVDWFLPVGSWVASLSSPPGFVELGGANSVKMFRQTFNHHPRQYSGDRTYNTTTWPINNYRTELVVQRNPGFPSGVLNPPWNMELSTSRCIDAIALLSQLFSDRSRR